MGYLKTVKPSAYCLVTVRGFTKRVSALHSKEYEWRKSKCNALNVNLPISVEMASINGVADLNYELSSRQFLKPRTELTCG
jgi:hypothetical protein